MIGPNDMSKATQAEPSSTSLERISRTSENSQIMDVSMAMNPTYGGDWTPICLRMPMDFALLMRGTYHLDKSAKQM